MTTARDASTVPGAVSIRQTAAIDRALGAFRLPVADAADLRWFFSADVSGDVGQRSNWGPAIARAERLFAAHRADEVPPRTFPSAAAARLWHERDTARVWHLPEDTETIGRQPIALDDALLHAAGRLNDLSWRWRGLGPGHQATLRAVYGPTAAPPREWGDLWLLVLDSWRAWTAHRRARVKAELADWLRRLPLHPAQASLCSELRREAEVRLLAASRAWLATWQRRRRAA